MIGIVLGTIMGDISLAQLLEAVPSVFILIGRLCLDLLWGNSSCSAVLGGTVTHFLMKLLLHACYVVEALYLIM